MNNGLTLLPFNNSLKGPVFIIHGTGTLKDLLVKWLEDFTWHQQTTLELIHFQPEVSDDEILKSLVPIMENNRRLLAISSDSNFTQSILKAKRYLNAPFIFNSISENTDDIKLFYNVSNIMPNQNYEGHIKNLLRLDFTGIQVHQSHPSLYNLIEQTQSRVLRLGQIKENIHISEPSIREADMINLNVNVLKISEFPAQSKHSQSGLTSEEACQIIRYIGMSEKNKSCIITGINEDVTHLNQSLNVCAQMVWYFCDAANQLKGDFPNSHSDMTEYLVSLDEYDHEIVFVKSEKSGRWWLKPDVKIPKSLESHSLYPVAYEDYEITSKGGLSEHVIKGLLWFERISKM